MGYIKYDYLENLSFTLTSPPNALVRYLYYRATDRSAIRKQGSNNTGNWFNCSFKYNDVQYNNKRLYMATNNNNAPITSVTDTPIDANKPNSLYVSAPNPPFGSVGGDSPIPEYISKIESFLENDPRLKDKFDRIISRTSSFNSILEFAKDETFISDLKELGNSESEELNDYIQVLLIYINQIKGGYKEELSDLIKSKFDDYGFGDIFKHLRKIKKRINEISETDFSPSILILTSRKFNDFYSHKAIHNIWKNLNFLKDELGDLRVKNVELMRSQDVDIINHKEEYKKYDVVFLIGHGHSNETQKFVYQNGYDNSYFHLSSEHIKSAFKSSTAFFLFSCSTDAYKDLGNYFENYIIGKTELIEFSTIETFVESFLITLLTTNDVELAIESGNIAAF